LGAICDGFFSSQRIIRRRSL